MKHRLVFLGCCLLLLAGFHAAAQDYTAPPPPPEADTSPLPGPDGSTPAASAPARGSASGSASSGSAARSTARTPAQAAPAQSTPARSTPAQAATAQPEAAPAQEGIPSKGMFWGAMIGGGYNYYAFKNDGYGSDADGGSFNLGFLFGYDFGLLALQGELLINTGGGSYEYEYDYGWWYYWEQNNFNMTTLQIPVLLKLDLHWRRIMFQPQAGFYLNFGLGDLEYDREYYDGSTYPFNFSNSDSTEYSSPLFGLMFGGAFGVRIGRGYLFLDLRYAVDLGEIKIDVDGSKWNRDAVMLNLGYQYYFRSKQ